MHLMYIFDGRLTSIGDYGAADFVLGTDIPKIMELAG